MANRPVFISKKSNPYFEKADIEFVFNSGFAVVQKQKNITEIHRKFKHLYPDKEILEISSKSMQEIGIALSAFHLVKHVPSIGKSIPVENVFQGGKKFSEGGPYVDLYHTTPKEAKRDERLRTSGQLTAFCYENKDYPLTPKTAFYDWLYINALLENRELAEGILEFDAFTDIEFNPEKSINCQAKAAAVFVSLSRMGMIEQVRSFESFMNLYSLETIKVEEKPKQEPKMPKVDINTGDTIIHRIWGTGTVLEANSILTVLFESVGEKKLGVQWVADNCEIIK